MSTTYKSINYDRTVPDDLSKPFEIICHPDTDLWEKPPSTHSFTSPIFYQVVTKKSFRSARITVSAGWKHLYDQGGLALLVNKEKGKRQWVKTGVEFFNNEPNVSTVGTYYWSDWSLRPVEDKAKPVTVEIEDIKGTLWVWLIDESDHKLPLREVAWWGEISDDAELWVGAYAAKPAKEQDDLIVNFTNFVLRCD